MPAMTLSDRVYQKLKSLILSGRYSPDTVLSERSLATKLSVSRVPVREAIKALEREGLLIVIPYSGILIRRLSIDEVRDLYEVRQAIEGMAAYLCARSPQRAKIVQMRKRLQDLDTGPDFNHAAIQRASSAFHRTLFDLGGNSQLRLIYEGIEPKIDLNLRLTAVHAPERVEEALHEHLGIAAAIENGQASRAEQRMRDHLEHGKTARIAILSRLAKADAQESEPQAVSRRRVA